MKHVLNKTFFWLMLRLRLRLRLGWRLEAGVGAGLELSWIRCSAGPVLGSILGYLGVT